MSTTDDRNVDPLQEMTRLAQGFIDLARWSFKESYRSSESGQVIYSSEQCRINFVWGGWDYIGGNTISIYYGRIHAPSERTIMVWKGEECHCWHRVNEALHFLDGLSPQEAIDQMRVHQRWPRIMEEFRQSELGQNLAKTRRQPEWLVRMHAAVWEHYGQRLFELFDIRRPDLWEQYRQFIKEFYDIKGRSPNITPPLDKIC